MKKDLPWASWGTAALAAYGLKLHYSRASAGDLAWILAPTARAVGGLRGETLTAGPGGWLAPDGSYVIAPACAGVNFLIVAFAVAVLGFAHRQGSAGRRLAWWLGSLAGAWALTVGVNTLRIVAAVELYRLDLGAWLTPERAHRLLGIVIYLGALWAVWGILEGLTRRETPGILLPALLVPGAYLGMTVLVPILNGTWRQGGERYAEHAIMVTLVTMLALAALFLARAPRRGGERRS